MGFTNRWGHLAILVGDRRTIYYYYHEWRPTVSLTAVAQGRPVMSKKFDSVVEAVRELSNLGYSQVEFWEGDL